MENKPHIKHLPVIAYPAQQGVSNTEIAVSIPIFYSGVDFVQLGDEVGFDHERFKSIHCKGAIWVAISILANTDLADNNVGVFFHVEDRIYDAAKTVFDEFGVPEEFVRKIEIPDSEYREMSNPHFGKKFMCLIDDEFNPEVNMIVDSDSFFCSKRGKIRLYDKLTNQTFKRNPSAMHSHISSRKCYGWLKGACEAAGILLEPEYDLVAQEKMVYDALGLPLEPAKELRCEDEVLKHYCFTNVMTIPSDSDVSEFVSKHFNQCYQDECLLSLWADAGGNLLELSKLLPITEYSLEIEYMNKHSSVEQYVAHMHKDTSVDANLTQQYIEEFYEDITRNIKDVPRAASIKTITFPTRLRFHCLGIPHAITNDEYIACAFTQKVKKFCEMMTNLGHTCIHYGNELSELVCSEHVSVITERDLKHTYGDHDWRASGFEYDQNDHASHVFYSNCDKEIRQRYKEGDFVLCFWGWGHKQLADRLSDLPVHIVEPGIGYDDTFAQYRVWESITDMHYQHGASRVRMLLEQQLDWLSANVVDNEQDENRKQMGIHILDRIRGWRWWDKNWNMNLPDWGGAYIPNYFDPRQFTYQEEKEDFALFIGRIGEHKGIHVAVKMAEEAGCGIKIAGQGDAEAVLRDSLGYQSLPDFVEVVGYADVETRKELFAKAKAILTPSFYRDPFLGVHIEAGFAGTPNISTNWGAPCHTILHGYNGYLMNNFEHGVWALKNIHKIKPRDCRDWAMNFSMDRISLMYHEWFHSLKRHIANCVEGENFFYTYDDREELDWLQRPYPQEKVEQRIRTIQAKIKGEQ